MRTQTYTHMRGGKILSSILVLLTIGLIGLVYLLFTEKSVDFLSIIMILAAVGTIAWVTYKFYKPGFTDIIFHEDGIISKTHFEREELRIEDIEGIWFLQTPNEDGTIEEYSPTEKVPKNSLIVIGSINCFYGAEYFGLNGPASTLHDTFDQGYTAIHYRKELDEVLEYYYHKIKKG